jgi:hypothetical protein
MRSIEPTDVPPYFWTINTDDKLHAPRGVVQRQDDRCSSGRAVVQRCGVECAPLVVFSTFPDADTAARIARTLVDELHPSARRVARPCT